MSTADNKKESTLRIMYSDKEGVYLAEGSFQVGYMGTYRNDMITVDFDENDLWDDNYDYIVERYQPLRSYFTRDMNKNQIAEALTTYYKDRQNEIDNQIDSINNTMLAYMLDDIIESHNLFWEGENDDYAAYIIKEKMPSVEADNLEDVIFTEEAEEAFRTAIKEYIGKSQRENVEKPQMLQLMLKYFPMIDIHKLISTISPEYLTLEGANIVFQCSDSDMVLLCGAYAEIHADNHFYDWHNF